MRARIAQCSSLTLRCRATSIPSLNDLDGIFVYNIDDLQQVVASHIGDRRKEAVHAETMVEEEVRKL